MNSKTPSKADIERLQNQLADIRARVRDEERKKERKEREEKEAKKRLRAYELATTQLGIKEQTDVSLHAGEIGVGQRYPDTGEAGLRKRKYPDTGGWGY